ncbi:MAG: 16S rRNA (guanine(527)-N(7))-methyltransferase RsmG [Rhodoferax sp.]|nr:16S rRNA (guanine(527)-N(7))-methyltransferase RsmG [Rhodoferax sp.]
MDDAAVSVALEQGAQTLGVRLDALELDQLLAYLHMLEKWGRVYNLTALRTREEMLTHHLLDSLALITPLRRYLARSGSRRGARLLDVGSGAGLPGVVAAVCCPQLAVTCVDTVAEKAAFVTQVALRLRLGNLCSLQARVESVAAGFDIVVARAFASLADLAQMSAGALDPGGVWIAMKGRLPEQELAALSAAVQVFHVEPLQVPGLDAQRCLVWMAPASGV